MQRLTVLTAAALALCATAPPVHAKSPPPCRMPIVQPVHAACEVVLGTLPDGKIAALNITPGSRISSLVQSPTSRTWFFVRSIPDPEPEKRQEAGSDGTDTQIMSISYPYAEMHIVLNPKADEEPERNLTGFRNLALSADGGTLYFIAWGWATSGAVHAFDTATGTEHFICSGNDLIVVRKGQYRGDLAVQKHKYMVAGGSYDSYWLVTPDGKELGLLANSRREAEAILNNN